jgi:hypothetical protein
MVRRMTLRVLAALIALTSTIRAQESESAAAVTAPGRKMALALDGVLGGAGSEAPAARTLYLLVDPSAGLVQNKFVAELRRALDRNQSRLVNTTIGVAGVGVRGGVTLQPTRDQAAIVAAVAGLLQDARDDIRNVYASVRAVAAAFPSKSGDREILLIALQNGDAEDDIEATVRELERRDVRFRCIASEAYVADSYWAARPYVRKPSKTKLTGGDGAFVALPWGWIMQMTIANEVAPSGYAAYGLSRLARETEGRVHLFAAPNSTKHQCAIYGRCLFCDGDHAPSVDTYWRSRLGRYAPSIEDRSTVFRRAGADPWFRAMLKAWKRASGAGLLRGTPSVKLTGNGLAPQRSRVRRTFAWGSANFASQAKRAAKAARECGRIFSSLKRDLAALEQTKGIPRYKAMAEYTLLMLQLTKVNLTTFAGWCREIAPGLVAKNAPTIVPPQKAPRDNGRRPAGVGYTNFSLCHGVGPFENVDLPGGKALRDELAALRTLTDRFELLYGHTPMGVAVHRAGIAAFHFTYPGLARARPRKRPKSSTDKNPITQRGRPTRPGRSSGGTGGPTTGK